MVVGFWELEVECDFVVNIGYANMLLAISSIRQVRFIPSFHSLPIDIRFDIRWRNRECALSSTRCEISREIEADQHVNRGRHVSYQRGKRNTNPNTRYIPTFGCSRI